MFQCLKLQNVKTQFASIEIYQLGKSRNIFVPAVNDIPEANQHSAYYIAFPKEGNRDLLKTP